MIAAVGEEAGRYTATIILRSLKYFMGFFVTGRGKAISESASKIQWTIGYKSTSSLT
jgi:hypothetical protein